MEGKRCPSCGKLFKKDEPYPDVENCEVCERYGPPAVKEEFCYNQTSRDMWRELVHDTQKQFDISFDLENDSDVVGRDIVTNDHKFYCELWKAGGDWQNPICYFRCEIKNGYIEDPLLSPHSHPHFVYIPGIDEGNPHLTRTKKGKWSAPDTDSYEDGEEPDEKLCWQSLEKYLENLN